MATLLALPEGGEWIVLLVIVVVLFGANKLPDLTRNAAKALVEFRKISDRPELVGKPAEVENQQINEQNKPQV